MTLLRDKILALHAKGVSQREIARRLKTTRDIVRSAARGLQWRDVRCAPELIAEALARYQAGERITEISGSLGVGRCSVRRWAAEAGIAPRPGWALIWRPEWTEEALEMKRNGATWREIGAKFSVSMFPPRYHITRAIREGRLTV